MIKIDREKLNACNRVLNEASKIKTFSEENSTIINKLSEWLYDPNNDVTFSFNIDLSNNGESINCEFGFDGDSFTISEIHHSYVPEVGGDTFTTYEFSQSDDVYEEVGDIYSWENQAIEMLGFVGTESPEVEISINFEEGEE